jgi:hypothetical protein
MLLLLTVDAFVEVRPNIAPDKFTVMIDSGYLCLVIAITSDS